MESGGGVPKEHLTNGRGHYNGEVFQVVDFEPVAHLEKLVPIFWQAWLFVHNQDKSGRTEITLNGRIWEVTEAEALIHWYLLDQKSKFKLALDDKEIVGVLVYNPVFEGVFAIRLCYVMPHKMGTKTGHKLISSLENVRALIFQTKKDNDPENMWNVTRGRQVKVTEDDLVTTWIMNWEKK